MWDTSKVSDPLIDIIVHLYHGCLHFSLAGVPCCSGEGNLSLLCLDGHMWPPLPFINTIICRISQPAFDSTASRWWNSVFCWSKWLKKRNNCKIHCQKALVAKQSRTDRLWLCFVILNSIQACFPHRKRGFALFQEFSASLAHRN